MGSMVKLVRFFSLVIAGMMTDKNLYIEKPRMDDYYVLMIDAGSSGTRVHAYKFSLYYNKGTQLFDGNIRLEAEMHSETNPGLSSYAHDPQKAADSVVKLVKDVEGFVPARSKRVTPLLVRATAGLRQLEPATADRILNFVHRRITYLGYKVNKRSVKILKEAEEGINMWYALNLLTNDLKTGPRMAIMEMGGASAQVAFELDPSAISEYSRGDIYVRPAVCNTLLFSHSFLGQGISRGRYGTLLAECDDKNATDFESVCVDPEWKNHSKVFYGRNITVSGVSRKGLTPQNVFDRCQDVVWRYINSTMGSVKAKGITGQIAALGYYYIFATNEGLVPKGENGVTTLEKLYSAAVGPSGGCASDNTDWRCFDAVYIYTLLSSGYGISKTTEIHMVQDIDGYSVDWVLGVAYNYVMSAIAEKPGPAHVYSSYLRKILS